MFGLKHKAAAAVVALSAAAPGAALAQTYNYGEALQKSVYFYELQRSGDIPSSARTEWRGDSGMTDGSDVGKDLTGGWYDAGDHVKFGFPMAFTSTMLSWGVIEYRSAYQSAGQLDEALDNIKWSTDYFIKAHTGTNEFYGQVGDGDTDHAWWGPAEVMPMARPSMKISATCPGSDLAAETAAALAAASIAFRATDPTYADLCLSHAQQLYTFADTYRGTYDACITDAGGFYKSWSGYNDELTWGALWLYKATNDATYLTKAQQNYANMGKTTSGKGPNAVSVPSYKWTVAWDDKSYGCYVLMAKATGNSTYMADAERWLNWWSVGGTEHNADGTKVTYTPGGLAWLDSWGALRYSANTSFCAMVYSDWLASRGGDQVKITRYHDFALNQARYMLGSNPRSSSYVCGYGANPPVHPHHRGAHGSWSNNIQIPTHTRHILTGALVGGPASNDAWDDDRTDYVQNEVACDYNAGFTGLLARLYQEYGGSPLSSFPVVETRDDDELYTQAAVTGSSSNSNDIKIMIMNKSAWPARATNAMSFKYFFTLEPGVSPSQYSYDISYTTCNPLVVTGPHQYSGSIYYYLLDATGTIHHPGSNLNGGGSEPRKEIRLTIQCSGTYDPTNDFSYQGIPPGTTPTKTTSIPYYNAGLKVWGNEPAGSSTPPSTPTNLAATAGDALVSLTWSASSGASSYNVKRSTTSGSGYSTVASGVLTTNHTDTGLTNGTTYYYVVSAVNSAGESGNSNQTSATPQASASAPAAPSSLSGTGISSSQIDLSWTDNSGNESGFELEQASSSSGPWATIATLAPNVTSHSITGLTKNTTYYFRVKACNSNGCSAYSNTASAKTKPR